MKKVFVQKWFVVILTVLVIAIVGIVGYKLIDKKMAQDELLSLCEEWEEQGNIIRMDDGYKYKVLECNLEHVEFEKLEKVE